MMGLGLLGGGGTSSSSSSSNLSALAPPFSVDRFNSKPFSTQFSDSPYTASAFRYTWQYPTPSAPNPDLCPKSELEIESTTINSVPLPNDYGFPYPISHSNDPPPPSPQAITWSVNPSSITASGSFLYDCKVDPYYTPYVSSVLNCDFPSMANREPSYGMLPSPGLESTDMSSQVDYAQDVHGLDYIGQLHGVWNGTLDTKLAKQSELGGRSGSFMDEANAGGSNAFKKQMMQGFHTLECGDILAEHSGKSCGQFSDIIRRESDNDFVGMEHGVNMSHLVQNALSVPFESSRTEISNCSFTTPVSYPPVSSLHSPMNSANYHRSQNALEKCIQPFDSSVSGSVSITKSSPALVIRPPPSGSATMSQRAVSCKTLDARNIAVFNSTDGMDINNQLKGKEPQILRNLEVEEGSLISSPLNSQKEGSSQLFSVSSSIMEELSSNPSSRNGLEVKFRSQVQNLDATNSCSLPVDSFQAVKFSDIGLDGLDHHYFAVDSPCWKGAPASHCSPFDVVQNGSTHQFGKKINNICQLDLQVSQTFPPPIHPVKCSANSDQGEVHECGTAGIDVLAVPGPISDADCTARELMPVDLVKATLKGPTMTESKGVHFSEEYVKYGEDCELPEHSKIDFESKSSGCKQLGVDEENSTTTDRNFRHAVVESVLDISNAAEGSVAVCAAENVLCSPSSKEVGCKQAKLYGGESAPKMDVQPLINALRSLSELLLFGSFPDSHALKDQDLEDIKHVVRNLDKLTSKKVKSITQSQETLLHNSDKVGGIRDPHMGNSPDKCHFESEVRESDYLSRDEQMRNNTVIPEKAGGFQPYNLSRDDLDVLRDDNMTQAIRKVLEENFTCEEELGLEALLFKNLWLEAEAKLCSIGYRVRFDRMKLEMEKFKSIQAKTNAATLKIRPSSYSPLDLNATDMPSCMVGNDLNRKSRIWSLPSLSLTSKAHGVESSVMARFDELKSTNLVREGTDFVGGISCGEALMFQGQAKNGIHNSPVEPECHGNQAHVGLHIGGSGDKRVQDDLSSSSNTDFQTAVMTRFHILKCRDDLKTGGVAAEQAGNINAVYSHVVPFHKGRAEEGRGLNLAMEPHPLQAAGDANRENDSLHVLDPGYESTKDLFLYMSDDHGQRKQHSSLGSNDNHRSSDWEHVLKDDASSWR